ncbi:MAG: hypothetical protein OEM24_13115 [Paracoccaceae bacterium]|nr:hypothetical protein [Paracoccaceae bacterium]
MKPSDRLLFATSALLYSGPLYAGLAGYGFATLPLFAAFLMAWLFIVRPGDWPETREDWRVPRAVAWPLLIFAVQMVVAGFCLAMGRAIGGMYALTLPLPLAVPVGLSVLGILIAAALKRRGTGAPILRVPGGELGIGAGILDVARPAMPGRRDVQGFVEDVAEALDDLGEGPAAEEDIGRLAELVEEKGMTRETFEALQGAGELTLPQLQLCARLALSPPLMSELLGQGRIARALERALFAGEAALVGGTARLARDRLGEMPALADELPPAMRLRQAAEAREDAGRDAAVALALLANALDPPKLR